MPAGSAPAKDAARIAGMFDAIAARYDFLNGVLSAGLDTHWRRRAIDILALEGHETLVDLCTGTGDLALAAVSGTRRAARVVGVDFSAAMLRIAGEKVRRGAPASVVLVRGDATAIPVCDGCAHGVTIGFGIRNVERPLDAFREILRVLAPGGRLVILEFSLPRTVILRQMYRWYFRRVLPLIGRVVSRHPSAYTYLPQSVEAFPSPEAFCQALRDAGFGTVRAIPLTFGVVFLFVAQKGPPTTRVL